MALHKRLQNLMERPCHHDAACFLGVRVDAGDERHDVEAPLFCSEEPQRGIPEARMVVFERSGHAPFVDPADRSCRPGYGGTRVVVMVPITARPIEGPERKSLSLWMPGLSGPPREWPRPAP